MPYDQIRHVLLFQKILVELQNQKSLELHVHLPRVLHVENGPNKGRRVSLKGPRIIDRLAVPYDTSVQQLSLSLQVLMQGAQPLWPGPLDKTLPLSIERFEAGVAFFQFPDIHPGEQSATRCNSFPIALLAKDAVFQTRRRDLRVNLERFTQPLEVVRKFLIKSANAGRQVRLQALLFGPADFARPAVLQNRQSADDRDHT